MRHFIRLNCCLHHNMIIIIVVISVVVIVVVGVVVVITTIFVHDIRRHCGVYFILTMLVHCDYNCCVLLCVVTVSIIVGVIIVSLNSCRWRVSIRVGLRTTLAAIDQKLQPGNEALT